MLRAQPHARHQSHAHLLLAQTLSLFLGLLFLLRLDGIDIPRDGVDIQLLKDVVRTQYRDLDVLGARLDDFQQGLYRQLYSVFIAEIVYIVFFQEIADGLGGAANGMGLPRVEDAGGFCLVQLGDGVVRVEAGDDGGDSKGTDAAGLGVALLDAGDVAGEVLDQGQVLQGQAVGLGLDTDLVDEDAGVGVQARKGEERVGVDLAYFAGGDAGVLELEGGAFFAGEDHDVLALDADGAGAALDGLGGVLDFWGVLVVPHEGRRMEIGRTENVAIGTGRVSMGSGRRGGARGHTRRWITRCRSHSLQCEVVCSGGR